MRPSAEPKSVVRLAVTRFVILSSATLLILGVVTVLVSRYIAKEEALRDARLRTESIARTVAAPLVGSAVRSRDPAAMRELDVAMRNRIRYGSVSHIVLWDVEGRVLWSEDPLDVGEKFDLTPELLELAPSGGVLFKEPGEREPHPGREEDGEELLEIYVGAVDVDGEPFIFAAYLKPDRIDKDYRAVIVALLPASLLLLLLLQLATLPLALSLARRIDLANAHRSGILKRSLESWHEERRVLAHELHDGVIQDLAGMSYALHAVVGQLPEGPAADRARATGQVMSDTLVRSLAALRSMMLDLAPAGVDGAGLAVALSSLCKHMAAAGLDITLDLDADMDVGETAGGLIYRVVREGLRNAQKHSGATAVLVSVRRREDQVAILVSDDGRGLKSATIESGHVGLRLLGHVVRDLGGTIALGDAPRGGASLRVVVPAWLPEVDEQI